VSNSTEPLNFLNLQSPVDGDLINKINTLSSNQLIWLSGYCSGLAFSNPGAVAQQPALPQAENQLKVLVLYASQTGNTEALAVELEQKLIAQGVGVTLASTLDFKLAKLKDYSFIFILASTHGEGEPPDDAIEFHEGIFGRKAPKLDGVKHAVLGLGDTSYEFYCQTAKDFDQALSKLGSTALLGIKECDVDYEADATAWITDISNLIADESKALGNVTSAKVVPFNKASSASNTYSAKAPFTAEVLTIQKITSRDSVKDIYHIEIDLADSGISYQPGDSLGVVAPNSKELVQSILQALKADTETTVQYKDAQVNLNKLLTETLEVTLINKPSLKQLADSQKSTTLAAILDNEFSDYSDNNQWLDVLLLAENSVKPQDFVDVLKPIKPRLYSIASSLEENPDEVHLTVSLVRSTNENGERNGLASHYLIERLQEADKVQVYIDENKKFKLPESEKPIIMIGPGTGVAPFRAFLQERDATEASGKNWLFFGNPNFQNDFLYQTEFKKYLKSGLLSNISLAFSRDQKEKIYVQHRLYEQAGDVWQWINSEDASIYVCGDMSRMAKDVESTLLTVFSEQGGLDEEQAKDYLKKLKTEKRYQRDVY